MGNEVIDLSLNNIWKSWFTYRKGKKPSRDLDHFQYNLESELLKLWRNLNEGIYKHGSYKNFTVKDNKTREISVASVRDRVVHRLIYDYLTDIYDKAFIYDTWSCRKRKGLLAAIERTQQFMKTNSNGFVWRSDIRKFFDNVKHNILFKLLTIKIADTKALELLNKTIKSFSTGEGKGISIGNLTSQIFSNIYLNELDRYVKHKLKIKIYARYGDDFVIFGRNRKYLEKVRFKVSDFLQGKLKISLNFRNDLIIKTKYGLKFLGTVLYPTGRTLNRRNNNKIKTKLNIMNTSSYWGVIIKHTNLKKIKKFQWNLLDIIPKRSTKNSLSSASISHPACGPCSFPRIEA